MDLVLSVRRYFCKYRKKNHVENLFIVILKPNPVRNVTSRGLDLNPKITYSYVWVSWYIYLFCLLIPFRLLYMAISEEPCVVFLRPYPSQMIYFRHSHYGRISRILLQYQNSLQIYFQTRVSCKDLVVYLSFYGNPQQVV